MAVDFKPLVTMPRWTPREAFPPSRLLHRGSVVSIFSTGEGLYLLTNRNRGDKDPVWGVGWAESDYWARRVWASPQFDGELTAPPAQRVLPAFAGLDLPDDLSFAGIVDFETNHPRRATSVGLVNATVRVADGEILRSNVSGHDKITYCFAELKPKADDLPVAIEFRLA